VQRVFSTTVRVTVVLERCSFVMCVEKVPARPVIFLLSWNPKCTVFDSVLSQLDQDPLLMSLV